MCSQRCTQRHIYTLRVPLRRESEVRREPSHANTLPPIQPRPVAPLPEMRVEQHLEVVAAPRRMIRDRRPSAVFMYHITG